MPTGCKSLDPQDSVCLNSSLRTEKLQFLCSLFKTKERFEGIFAIKSPVWLEGLFGSECPAVGGYFASEPPVVVRGYLNSS